MLPASVVKSSAPTITGVPPISPEPETIPSAADERAELTKRALVKKVLEARAGVQLALAAMLGQPVRPAHRPRTLTPKIEVFERLLPALLVRHALFLSSQGRSLHRHVHIDHTESLTVASSLMSDRGGLRVDGAVSTELANEEVTTLALLRGMERSGRKRSESQLSAPIFVVTGDNEAELAAGAVGTRKQIAFYGSTPAYRKVLDLHGWGELHTDLHRLSLQGEWDAMASLIDDEILEAFAVVAPLDQVAAKIRDRCDGVIDRVLVGFPSSVEEATVTALLQELRDQPTASARSRP
jgi:alkanesulfonate monooxygenase SsuD/methylene tetrahydromethanopterin reductase-like flavin-dependent oxidoreductase (luciferase family)